MNQSGGDPLIKMQLVYSRGEVYLPDPCTHHCTRLALGTKLVWCESPFAELIGWPCCPLASGPYGVVNVGLYDSKIQSAEFTFVSTHSGLITVTCGRSSELAAS